LTSPFIYFYFLSFFLVFQENPTQKANCIKGCKGLSDFLNQKLFPLRGQQKTTS